MTKRIVEIACQVCEFTNEDIAIVIRDAYAGTKNQPQVLANLDAMLAEQIELFIDENPEFFD